MSDVRPTSRLTPLPALIFSSRGLQLPLYLGLIVAQGVYVFLFGKDLLHLIQETPSLDEQEIKWMYDEGMRRAQPAPQPEKPK